MPFFDEKTGALTLGKGYRLTAFMPDSGVLSVLRSIGGSPSDWSADIIPFSAIAVSGGRITLIAFLEEDRLSTIKISVVSIKPKRVPAADQQRAFLFSLFGVSDPCPDTQRSCCLAMSFGSLTISTDPRTGHASACLTYQ